MSANTFVPNHQRSPSLVLDDLPEALDSEELIEDEDLEAAMEASRPLHPHCFSQYCEHSLHVAELRGFRPTYIGYAFIPHQPKGVCH